MVVNQLSTRGCQLGACGNKLGGRILCLIASADWIHAWPIWSWFRPSSFTDFFRERLNSLVDRDLRCEIGICTLGYMQSRGYYCLQALPWLQTASNEAMGLHQNYTDVFCTEKGNYSSFYTTKLNGVSKTSKSAFRVKPPQPPIWSQMMILKADLQICEMM